jgi:hypothetical protein
MTMTNANTNRYEDNNIGGWKQVGSGKATGTDSANKTLNDIHGLPISLDEGIHVNRGVSRIKKNSSVLM